MATFQRRSEVTITSMGQVDNPSGSGIAATSQQVKAKTQSTQKPKSSPIHQSSLQTSQPPPAQTLLAPSSPILRPRGKSRGNSAISESSDGSSKRNINEKKSHAFNGHSNQGKKQGGSGKSKWNGLLETADEEAGYGGKFKGNTMVLGGQRVDVRDPLYDSEDEGDEKVVYVSSGLHTSFDVNDPTDGSYSSSSNVLTLIEYKRQITLTFQELFISEDIQECQRRLITQGCPIFAFEIVKRSISLSLDGSSRERELVSKLLSTCYPNPLTPSTVLKGFERLLENLDSLIIDCPSASSHLSIFIARAVVDDILPPSFLTDQVIQAIGGECIPKAVRLLSRDHSSVRLSKNSWGPGDGRSVYELKTAMDLLLKEFLGSRDKSEALKCIRELNCPSFHHELIKRAVKIAMEEVSSTYTNKFVLNCPAVADMVSLFQFLCPQLGVNGNPSKLDCLDVGQLKRGLRRVERDLEDLKLDCPRAEEVLEGFVLALGFGDGDADGVDGKLIKD